jgi:hypothetical protein
MKCLECEDKRATRKDPRNPPLETGKCLCPDCRKAAVEQLCEDLEQELRDYRAELAA